MAVVSAEHFEDHAQGRPYHAALVEIRGRVRPHGHHDYFEVMAVVDGAGRQELRAPGGRSVVLPMRSGDITLVRPGDEHALSAVGATGVRFYNIAFPASSWMTFADLAGTGSWTDAPLPPQQHLDTTGLGVALGACQTALDRFQHAPATLDLIAFWTAVIPLLATQSSGNPAESTPEWLVAACAAMRREDNLRAGVPRLQELAHVSAAHLARSVRRYYHTTPTALIAELRLRHAANLLATTTRSITEIAHRCGFASHSYFTRCFREAHRRSPREFRHRAQRAFVP